MKWAFIGWLIGTVISIIVSITITLNFNLDTGTAVLVGLMSGFGFAGTGGIIGIWLDDRS